MQRPVLFTITAMVQPVVPYNINCILDSSYVVRLYEIDIKLGTRTHVAMGIFGVKRGSNPKQYSLSIVRVPAGVP